MRRGCLLKERACLCPVGTSTNWHWLGRRRQGNARPRCCRPQTTTRLSDYVQLFVVGPHPYDFDDTLRFHDLIDKPVLNIDSPGVSRGQIPNQLFIRRWVLVRIDPWDCQQLDCVLFQSRSGKLFCILLSLLCIDKLPAHQSSSLEHSFTFSASPSLIDSLIPGTESRCKVSVIAFQSLSDRSTAFPLLPVIIMGSWVSSASSIRLYSLARASVALRIVMASTSTQ